MDLRADFSGGRPRRVFAREVYAVLNRSRNFLYGERLSGNHCATNDANSQIYGQSYHRNVQGAEDSSVVQRSGEACKDSVCGVRYHGHGEAGTDSGKQSDDQRLLPKPVSVQAEKERGQQLQNQNPAKKLELYRVGCGNSKYESESYELEYCRSPLCNLTLPFRSQILLELLDNIPRQQIRLSYRHDRRRHQTTHKDPEQRNPRQPAWKSIQYHRGNNIDPS